MAKSGRGTKSGTAYTLLRAKLLAGGFPPGERIVESRIAEELDCSRVPVREALQRLQSEGLLVDRGAGKSMTARCIEDMSPRDAVEHYEVREAIEGMAARLAAMSMNGWEIAELREIAEGHAEAASRGDWGASAENARRFHRYLVRHCGNSRLASIWETHQLVALSARTPGLGESFTSHLPPGRDVASELAPIVEAIAAHDPDAAERAMREFAGSATRAIRQALRAQTE